MVYILGEDQASKSVVKRIFQTYCAEEELNESLPMRGGEFKNPLYLNKLNRLAETQHVFCLLDSDEIACPGDEISRTISSINANLRLRYAVTEVESWLLSDISGFASYYKIPIGKMPEVSQRRAKREILVNYKPSLFLMHLIQQNSSNQEFVRIFTPINRSRKSPEYNSGIIPYILHAWNPEEARKNSSSLDRMIFRVEEHCRNVKQKV